MKLDYNDYPLNIFEKQTSKSLLKSIDTQVPSYQFSRLSISEFILSSFVKKAAGAGLLSLSDNASIGLKGKKARKCLAKLVREQTSRVAYNPSVILDEAQINLLATSCVTGYLSSLEARSFGNGAKNVGKIIVGLLDFRNPLEVLFESVKEVSGKYDDICQVYYVSFLLNVYNSNHSTEDVVKRLITESLCNDSAGEDGFSLKKRPVLFSSVQYKSLEENLRKRLNILNDVCERNGELYDPFVKWRRDVNSE